MFIVLTMAGGTAITWQRMKRGLWSVTHVQAKGRGVKQRKMLLNCGTSVSRAYCAGRGKMSKDKKKMWVNIRYEFPADVETYECIEGMLEDGDLTGVLEVCDSECDDYDDGPKVTFGQDFQE
jgi:hypothetical protein